MKTEPRIHFNGQAHVCELSQSFKGTIGIAINQSQSPDSFFVPCKEIMSEEVFTYDFFIVSLPESTVFKDV
jgi:hypothetical protein